MMAILSLVEILQKFLLEPLRRTRTGLQFHAFQLNSKTYESKKLIQLHPIYYKELSAQHSFPLPI